MPFSLTSTTGTYTTTSAIAFSKAIAVAFVTALLFSNSTSYSQVSLRARIQIRIYNTLHTSDKNIKFYHYSRVRKMYSAGQVLTPK